jgi:hypothetical protein
MRIRGSCFANIKIAHARGMEHVRGPELVPEPFQRVMIGHAHGRNVIAIRNFHLRRPDAEKIGRIELGFQFLINRPAVNGGDAGDENARHCKVIRYFTSGGNDQQSRYTIKMRIIGDKSRAGFKCGGGYPYIVRGDRRSLFPKHFHQNSIAVRDGCIDVHDLDARQIQKIGHVSTVLLFALAKIETGKEFPQHDAGKIDRLRFLHVPYHLDAMNRQSGIAASVKADFHVRHISSSMASNSLIFLWNSSYSLSVHGLNTFFTSRRFLVFFSSGPMPVAFARRSIAVLLRL